MTFRCDCGAPATIGYGKDPSPTDPKFIPFRDYCSACFAAQHPEGLARMRAAAETAQDYLDDRKGTQK